ncbi:MAG: hypothetical protein JRH07_07235, partial [Deltaproteobacteria bacterium]|nr:hypothetical protein [Deltaproteobacteria bacterium]
MESRKPIILKPYGSVSWERETFAPIAEVKGKESVHGQPLVEAVREASILLADVDITVSQDVVRAAAKLKGIVCFSTGLDYVDLAAATERGIYVTNVPDLATESVAEYTIGLALALVRKVPRAEMAARQGKWQTRGTFQGRELTGKTLGIIGLGRIGRALATKAKALGMGVIFYDPFVADATAGQ